VFVTKPIAEKQHVIGDTEKTGPDGFIEDFEELPGLRYNIAFGWTLQIDTHSAFSYTRSTKRPGNQQLRGKEARYGTSSKSTLFQSKP